MSVSIRTLYISWDEMIAIMKQQNGMIHSMNYRKGTMACLIHNDRLSRFDELTNYQAQEVSRFEAKDWHEHGKRIVIDKDQFIDVDEVGLMEKMTQMGKTGWKLKLLSKELLNTDLVAKEFEAAMERPQIKIRNNRKPKLRRGVYFLRRRG